MKKIYFLQILFLLFPFGLKAQQFVLGMQSGLGNYAMTGLKDLNGIIASSLSFDTQVVDNFPPYLYFRPTMMLQFSNWGVGLNYNTQSTGSRLSAKDFSGEYHFDMKVYSGGPGIYGEYKLSHSKFLYTFYSSIGLSFSQLTMNEYLELNNSVYENSTYQLSATNGYFEPGLCIHYTIKHFSIGANVGYQIKLGNQAFYYGSDKSQKLTNTKTNESIKPEWDGLRIGVSLFYSPAIFHGPVKSKEQIFLPSEE